MIRTYQIFTAKLFFIICISIFSCNNSNNSISTPKTSDEVVCKTSSKDLFDSFKKTIQQKDLISANKLCEQPESYIDTIFSSLKNPQIELIPQQKDGAFGIKKIGEAELYYTRIMENNKTNSIKGVLIQKKNECFLIINIANVDTTK